MSKKSERSNRNSSNVGRKGRTMSGDDTGNSKKPVDPFKHENRKAQKIHGNRT